VLLFYLHPDIAEGVGNRPGSPEDLMRKALAHERLLQRALRDLQKGPFKGSKVLPFKTLLPV